MSEIGRGAPALEGILAAARRGLGAAFGAGEAPRLFFAPGRVNLMGAHVDYNGGPVLPMAIDRGTWVLARPCGEPILGLACAREEGSRRWALDALPAAAGGSWSDYPLGVVRRLLGLRPGPAPGLELYFTGDLPVGAGLASSASLCVATAIAVGACWELERAPVESAHDAWRAEREFVGVPCGRMDPYAIGLARARSVLWLECEDGAHEHVPIDPDAFRVAVVDSGVRRELARSAYAERVAECRRAFEVLRGQQVGASCLAQIEAGTLEAAEPQLAPVALRRARHVISEVTRTRAARTALEAARFQELGRLMLATHESLRSSFEVSRGELDFLVHEARGLEGVHGARLTGAGFGGCVAILLAPGAEDGLRDVLVPRFARAFGRVPRFEVFGCGGGPREVSPGARDTRP